MRLGLGLGGGCLGGGRFGSSTKYTTDLCSSVAVVVGGGCGVGLGLANHIGTDPLASIAALCGGRRMRRSSARPVRGVLCGCGCGCNQATCGCRSMSCATRRSSSRNAARSARSSSSSGCSSAMDAVQYEHCSVFLSQKWLRSMCCVLCVMCVV